MVENRSRLGYVSYDDGMTWSSLGVKATGDKGDKGDKGDTGNDGQNGLDGAGVASVTVNPDGSIIVRLTGREQHRNA